MEELSDFNLEFSRNGAAFMMDLFSQIAFDGIKENVIFSPFSIQACLALAYAGARGETAKEISDVMKYVSNVQLEVAQTFQYVLDRYHNSSLLKIANKAYVQEGAKIVDAYQHTLKEYYHTEAETVNFADNVNTANAINEWVESMTGGNIKNLISSECLNSLTRLVLLNALHFKGNWESKFDETLTSDDDFWTSKHHSIEILFMFQKNRFSFGFFPELECKTLEMPYKNSDLSMFVLLPNKREGLKKLLPKLKSINLVDLSEKMFVEEVEVKFPIFKTDFSLELSDTLKKLGLTHIFKDTADFSNMLQPSEGLQVSTIMHKASIEVNEEGTEAAAATGMVVTFRTAPRVMVFNADHPFLYLVWNKKNILFAGVFKAPNREFSI